MGSLLPHQVMQPILQMMGHQQQQQPVPPPSPFGTGSLASPFIGLTGLDPRFLDDPRYPPIIRQLTDKDREQRGFIVKMASPHDGTNADAIERSGGWDSAPVGLGDPSMWPKGHEGIVVKMAADESDESLRVLMHKLAIAPVGSNLGTSDEDIGRGAPNYTDPWMYKTVKEIVGDKKHITPAMIKEFRTRLLTDPVHRAEMMY